MHLAGKELPGVREVEELKDLVRKGGIMGLDAEELVNKTDEEVARLPTVGSYLCPSDICVLSRP